MVNSMLNFASKPVCGWWLRRMVAKFSLRRTLTAATSPGLTSWSRTSASIPSMARCVQ